MNAALPDPVADMGPEVAQNFSIMDADDAALAVSSVMAISQSMGADEDKLLLVMASLIRSIRAGERLRLQRETLGQVTAAIHGDAGEPS